MISSKTTSPFAGLVKHGLKFALGGAAIWALIGSGILDPRLVARAFSDHPGLCLAAFATYAAVLILAWLRWLLLLRLAGLRVGVWQSLILQMIGFFFNGLLPGGTGGDLAKGYYLFRGHEKRDRPRALTTLAMDRFAGLYGLLWAGLVMALCNYGLWKDSPALRLGGFFYGGVFLAFTCFTVFFFSPWSGIFLGHPAWLRLPGGPFLKSLFDALLAYRNRPGGLLLALLLSLATHAGLILMYYFAARALRMALPLLAHGFAVPMLTIINGIPLSPAGLGVGEAAGEWLYRKLGAAEGGGELLALVHIIVLAFSLAGAPVYFLYRGRRKAPLDKG